MNNVEDFLPQRWDNQNPEIANSATQAIEEDGESFEGPVRAPNMAELYPTTIKAFNPNYASYDVECYSVPDYPFPAPLESEEIVVSVNDPNERQFIEDVLGIPVCYFPRSH